MVAWAASEIQTNGIRIHAYQLGDGPPLLLLHGLSANARTWGRSAEALGKHRRVIAVDLRGHGHSDSPAPGYGESDFVADAAGVIRQLRVGPVDIIGHSLGGRIAMQLAGQNPEGVRRLVLEEAFGSRSDGITPEQEAQLRHAGMAWMEPFRQLSREEATAQVGRQSPSWTREECEAFADGQREVSIDFLAKGGMGYTFDWRERLSQIQCPTLVLGGDPDAGVFPPSGFDDAAAEEARRRLANGIVVKIPNAGHMVHLDQPEQFVEVVDDFLA